MEENDDPLSQKLSPEHFDIERLYIQVDKNK